MNLFDILGPVMVGPSSSHTAGAVRIGWMTQKLLGEQPVEAKILMYGSFAATGKGHGTDRGLVAGLLGMRPDDERIPDSFEIARKMSLSYSFGIANLTSAHPNSVVLEVKGKSGRTLEVQACSLGGGRIMINRLDGLDVNCSCEIPTLIVHNLDQPGHVAEVTSMLAHKSVNIANMSLYRGKRGGSAVMVVEMDQPLPKESLEWLEHLEGIVNVSREESIETMRGMWEAMKGAERNYDGSLQSRSGLVGGAGKTMRAYVESGNTLCGPFVGKVMASALAMGESNACMKRIVAAPTAGACGVLPAVLVNYQKEKGTADEQIVRALYTAAGIGQVVAARAYIAGASGGCQAEIGTASAMAAGALTALGGGTPSQITHAAAMALKNLLGLVCDPVGGLVEVPCVKRNVIGSVNALSAADTALAGIISRIPPDQVIDAMREVGDQMHPSLRETGQGGLANTPAAREWCAAQEEE